MSKNVAYIANSILTNDRKLSDRMCYTYGVLFHKIRIIRVRKNDVG